MPTQLHMNLVLAMMSTHLPTRIMMRQGLSYRSRSSRIARIGLQHRTIFNFFRKGSKNPPLDPLDFQVTHRKPTAPLPPPTPQRGDLASDSIFNTPSLSAGQDAEVIESPALQGRDPTLMEAALNPRPVARARWQRKMLIRSIQHRGRINKAVKLLRTERSHAAKSHFLETSVKKLYPLARQIAGKTIEDALIQMRFSKKRVAADVLKHLEYARDQAIVTRGMGLGKVGTEANAQTAGEAKPIVVREKNGRRRTIQDSTSMYIDQAWVGRGKKMWGVEFRAKGRTNMLHIPSTSITVLLKEENTRIRLANEREDKRKAKKAWVPHPDRPITAQRQYLMW